MRPIRILLAAASCTMVLGGCAASNPSAKSPKQERRESYFALLRQGAVVELTNPMDVDSPVLEVRLLGRHFGDATMALLAKFPSLESLALTNTSVTDAGFARLTGLPLGILHVDRTGLTDDSLNVIKQMRQLQELRLQKTGISSDAISELRSDLPKCRISARHNAETAAADR